MATLGMNALTLSDWSGRLDPNGKVSEITEVLAHTNEILDDAAWVEATCPPDTVPLCVPTCPL